MENPQKAQLVTMTNGLGWALAQKLGNDIIHKMEQEALDCEDDNKVLGLARAAKAAKRFWDAFQNNIENEKNPEAKDDSFVPVSY